MKRSDDYTQALEKALSFMKGYERREISIEEFSEIFPEFKREREDEKMRAMAIKAVYAPEAQSCIKSWGINPDDVIAWLERQQKPVISYDALREGITHVGLTQYQIDNWLKKYVDVEKQGEQNYKIIKGKNYLCVKTHNYAGVEWIKGMKYYASDNYTLVNQGCECYCPEYSKEEHNNLFEEVKCDGCVEKQGDQNHTDETKPKFHEGEWVVDKDGLVKRILSYKNGVYKHTCGYSAKRFEDEWRRWTIKDAKDGAVLATPNCILIFKKLLPEDGGVSYCHYDFGSSTPQFDFNKDENWYFGKETKVYPATKEQRGLLFKKMKEAGYEWSEETHELKEIDNEEINGEDYGIDSLWHAQQILEKTLGEVEGYQSDDGILEHKCAISAVKKLYAQKPVEWGEEDKKMLDDIIMCGERHCYLDVGNITWLKLLKERVYPQPKGVENK